jgi:TPR repeat protein
MKLKRAVAAIILVLSLTASVAVIRMTDRASLDSAPDYLPYAEDIFVDKETPPATFEDATSAFRRGDYATALRLFRALADRGNAGAQGKLGSMYYRSQGVPQDYAEAARWFRLAADQGEAAAQTLLGNMYSGGLGVRQDYAEAARWFRLAADQGKAIAQTLLGNMYSGGFGVPQDHAGAARWFRLAADQGEADAQSMLGFMYYQGLGMPQDYTEAARWSRLAADQGNARAQALLGMMYDHGRGVPQDFVSAHMWMNLASASGSKGVIELRDNIAQRMTPAQIAEGQKLAREWRPKMANAAPAEITPRSPSPKEPDSGATSGTAFFVSKDGTALTNAHVVERCEQIRVGLEGRQGRARIVARDDKSRSIGVSQYGRAKTSSSMGSRWQGCLPREATSPLATSLRSPALATIAGSCKSPRPFNPETSAVRFSTGTAMWSALSLRSSMRSGSLPPPATFHRTSISPSRLRWLRRFSMLSA